MKLQPSSPGKIMNTFLPAEGQINGSSLKIKGRIILYEEFAGSLRKLCAALGFTAAGVRDREVMVSRLPDMPRHRTEEGEAVIVLSCRVAYNPHWGAFGGHPQLLVQAKTDDDDEPCPAAFIAPFLQQYRFAQERIFLAMNGQGEHLITLPACLLAKTRDNGYRFSVLLDQVAEPDKDGNIVPVTISGRVSTYTLSGKLRQAIDRQGHVWQSGRSFPIGRYLGSELFSFGDFGPASDRNGLFVSTLLPYLNEIVTHRTPDLRAAEIHLSQVFARAVALQRAEYAENSKNVLYLAGLDIDMSGFQGYEEQHCFVPWQAYLAGRDEERVLAQDDLFIRLMQASKQ